MPLETAIFAGASLQVRCCALRACTFSSETGILRPSEEKIMIGRDQTWLIFHSGPTPKVPAQLETMAVWSISSRRLPSGKSPMLQVCESPEIFTVSTIHTGEMCICHQRIIRTRSMHDSLACSCCTVLLPKSAIRNPAKCRYVGQCWAIHQRMHCHGLGSVAIPSSSIHDADPMLS